MWTAKKTDQMVVRAENKVDGTIKDFLRVYYAGRLPTVEEIVAFTGLPAERVEAYLSESEESGYGA